MKEVRIFIGVSIALIIVISFTNLNSINRSLIDRDRKILRNSWEYYKYSSIPKENMKELKQEYLRLSEKLEKETIFSRLLFNDKKFEEELAKFYHNSVVSGVR